MDRKAFLSALGYTSGALLVTTCLGACAKNSAGNSAGPATPAPSVDFTLDLSLPANAPLNNPGGFVYSNGVIVAKTTAGNIIAVSQSCTHQGVDVNYVGSSNMFYCPSHGSTFTNSGAVNNGPANGPLKQYTTTVTGNKVRING